MSAIPFLSSKYTLTGIEERLSTSVVKVHLTCIGRGYLQLGGEDWVYLNALTNSVMSILEANPHFSEKERAAGSKLVIRLKSFYTEMKELQSKRHLLMRAIGACCGADDPDMMQLTIRDDLENLVTLYTKEQFKETFPRNSLPTTAADFVYGADLENPIKLYKPPALFR